MREQSRIRHREAAPMSLVFFDSLKVESEIVETFQKPSNIPLNDFSVFISSLST